jgi:signal peptidase I
METTSFPDPDMDVIEVEQPTTPQPDLRRFLQEIIQALLVVFLVVFGIRTFFQPYEVNGASMSPYLHNGGRLFVNRSAYTSLDLHALWHPLPDEMFPFSRPQRGDIIILETDQTSKDDQYIKRIIGLPGETITFRDGIVLIDGEPLVEDYIEGAITECGRTGHCSVTVPENHVYVLGDNRLDSEDSRMFGAIPYDDIVGKAIFNNWPFEKIGPIQQPDYGDPIEDTDDDADDDS